MCFFKIGLMEGLVLGGIVVIIIGKIILVLKVFFMCILNYMELIIKKYWIDIGENYLLGVIVMES